MKHCTLNQIYVATIHPSGSFRQRKETMLSHHRAQCAAPSPSIRHKLWQYFLLSHVSTYPRSILTANAIKFPTLLHTHSRNPQDSIPLAGKAEQSQGTQSWDGSVHLFCPISHTTTIYNCIQGTNIPATARLVLLEARVCRESLCAPISCVPLTDWSRSSAITA